MRRPPPAEAAVAVARHARLPQDARDRQALDAGEEHLRVFCE
ncbi:hypothetical protein AB0B56_27520 [Streptosporangium canum]